MTQPYNTPKVTDVAFIIPTRNNLEYVKLAYSSLREIYPNNAIYLLDDNSTDGTSEWVNRLATAGDEKTTVSFFNKMDPNDRTGHTVLYDKGFEQLIDSEQTHGMIFHADMVASTKMLENMLKWWRPGRVVSATRIEPPLHPTGPEKIIEGFGNFPDEFKGNDFTKFVTTTRNANRNQISVGVFAPWLISVEDMVRVGGHDALFAPMELEDSDIFNRWHNAGYDFVQSWDALVYHFTSRGSRWKDGKLGENSKEYTDLREIKMKEWQRRWRQPVAHDSNMKPIVQPVYYNVAGVNVPDEFVHYFDDIDEENADIVFKFPEEWDDAQHRIILENQGWWIKTTHTGKTLINGVEIIVHQKQENPMILPEIKNVL